MPQYDISSLFLSQKHLGRVDRCVIKFLITRQIVPKVKYSNIGNIYEQFNVHKEILSAPQFTFMGAWRIFTIICRKFLVHSTAMNAKFSLILIKIRWSSPK